MQMQIQQEQYGDENDEVAEADQQVQQMMGNHGDGQNDEDEYGDEMDEQQQQMMAQ